MSPLCFGDSGGELGGVATAGSEPVSPLGGWAVRATLGCWPEPKSTVRGTPNRAGGPLWTEVSPTQICPAALDCEGDKSSSNPGWGGGGLLFSKFPPVELESPQSPGGAAASSEPQDGAPHLVGEVMEEDQS